MKKNLRFSFLCVVALSKLFSSLEFGVMDMSQVLEQQHVSECPGLFNGRLKKYQTLCRH